MALILGVTFFVELYLDRVYPETQVEVVLPELQPGMEHVYSFYKDGERVGTYSYTVTGDASPYSMTSTTNLTYMGERLLLQGKYVFDSRYRPLSYEFNATVENKQTTIQATFAGGIVTLTVGSDGESVELTDPVPETAILIENQMPGYWEILFQSTALTPGKRYVVYAYIPQLGSTAKLTLTMDDETATVSHGGADLECSVVREADTGLLFHLYGGELIQYRDDANGVTMTKDF